MLYLIVGTQSLIVHTKCHLRRSNKATRCECLAVAAMVEKRQILAGFLPFIHQGIRMGHESPCLGTAEVQITIAVTRAIAPRKAIAVLSIVLGMMLIVVETVKHTLC